MPSLLTGARGDVRMLLWPDSAAQGWRLAARRGHRHDLRGAAAGDFRASDLAGYRSTPGTRLHRRRRLWSPHGGMVRPHRDRAADRLRGSSGGSWRPELGVPGGTIQASAAELRSWTLRGDTLRDQLHLRARSVRLRPMSHDGVCVAALRVGLGSAASSRRSDACSRILRAGGVGVARRREPDGRRRRRPWALPWLRSLQEAEQRVAGRAAQFPGVDRAVVVRIGLLEEDFDVSEVFVFADRL